MRSFLVRPGTPIIAQNNNPKGNTVEVLTRANNPFEQPPRLRVMGPRNRALFGLGDGVPGTTPPPAPVDWQTALANAAGQIGASAVTGATQIAQSRINREVAARLPTPQVQTLPQAMYQQAKKPSHILFIIGGLAAAAALTLFLFKRRKK